MKIFKQLFCKHEWEICRKNEPFEALGGEQFFEVCTKCGKVKTWMFPDIEAISYR